MNRPKNGMPVVLLDYDGVIVDSLKIFVEAVNVAEQELKRSASFTTMDLQTMRVMSVASILKIAKIDSRLEREFIEILDHELLRRAGEFKLFPQMQELIMHLSSEAVVGIVSATPGYVIKEVLKPYGLIPHFKHVAGGDSPGSKAERISAIVEANAAELANTWMIGDTISDIEQGKTAGCRTVAVSWGWHCLEWLREAEPHCEAVDVWRLADCVTGGCG